ncbi:hypothetical protein EMCG_01072 [[Emmonsia] crescens]|uniref:Uncharacterized protein n=1 Tax=[Emmonsia] crescens TaxID=73230 RepID=A0A0G2IAK2_9EURO|nr:hypothetical protein EMCG_01072 [Emmonsia crescens UAMH 3008]
MFRRKRASAHAPINPNPSPSAQTAAAQAFRASQANATISTAAAAAALRKHTPTPTSVENIQTKRMLQRQLSAGSAKGKVAQPRTQNGYLHRSSSSGSMTTRTFREQLPAHPGSIAGSSERNITPVPPLPQGFMAHRRTVSMDPSYRGIDPSGAPNRSPGARSPSSSRSPRVLSSLPELERQGSRSSINFSYPTHARPNSPPQSPTKKFVAKSPVSDEGRYPDEASRSHIAARTSKLTTPSITATPRESQSYPDLGAFHTKYDELRSPGIESTHTIAEIKTSTFPEEQDPTPSHYTHPTNLSLNIHGEDPGLHQPKARTPPEAQATEQHITDVSEAHDPKPHQMDRPTISIKLPKPQHLHGTAGDVENDKTPLPTGSAIESSPSTDIGTTSYIPSETSSHGRVHGPVSYITENPINERPHSLSPTRTTRFSSHLAVSLTGERLHDPPPRSMSPGKSALKHPTPQSSPGHRSLNNWPKSLRALSESSDGTSAGSDDSRRAGGKKRIPKVSFEDEPEVVGAAAMPSISQGPSVSSSPPWESGSKYSSFARNGHGFNTSNGNGEDAFDEVMKPRPALPSFGSVRGRRGLIEDHDKRQVHDGSSSPRIFASGNAFGGILHQIKHTRPHDTMSFPPSNPIPPEVTSVEGTGYDSMSERSSSSDDMADPRDFAPPGDSISSFAPSEVQKTSSDRNDDTGNETAGGPRQSENVPIISVHPATPALAEENTRSEWTRIPGGFPSPMPLSEHEKPELSIIDSAREPRAVTPNSSIHSQASSTPSVDGDESDDSSESVYSDAAENWSDPEGGGFGSINAIVDSPVSHVSSYTHTPPPDSPTRSKADKKWTSDVSLQRNEPRSSSPLGLAYTSAPLPVVEEEVLSSSGFLSKKGNTEGSGGSRPFKIQRLQSKSSPQGRVAATVGSARVAPNGQQAHTSTKSNRNAAKQKGPRSKPSKRTPSDTTTRHNGEYTSQKRNDPSSTKRPTENGHIPPSGAVSALDPRSALKDPTQPAAYDSDSSSSFKRDRRSPRSTTRYTFKRTLRTPSDSRPHSSGGNSAGISGRSTPPTSQRRPFSSDHNSPIRTTLRGSGGGLHTKSSSFASFGKSSKLKGVPSGLNLQAGTKPIAPLGHANDDDAGWPRRFRSRYEDSSDDEFASMNLSPVRGIPKRKDGLDGDSTDLEDSSDDETPKKVLRRPEPRRRSIIPSKGKAKPVPTSDTKTDGTTVIDATNESTNVIPNAPGGFLPHLPKQQRSIFSRLSRSKHRGSDDAKIRKSELDSAARRDSPLERSRCELQRNKSSRSSRNGGDIPLSSSVETDGPKTSDGIPIIMPPKEADVKKVPDLVGPGSWPLRSHTNAPDNIAASIPPIPEKDESNPERPCTSDGITKINGNATFRVSISGPTFPATESSNWTSRFRPRLHSRRGTNSPVGEDALISTHSDAGATTILGPDEKKKRKKLSLLKKAFGMSSRE